MNDARHQPQRKRLRAGARNTPIWAATGTRCFVIWVRHPGISGVFANPRHRRCLLSPEFNHAHLFSAEACAKATIERDVLVCGCYCGDCLHRIPEINKYSRPSLSLSLLTSPVPLASPFGDFSVGGARDESHTRRPDCPFPSSRLVNTDRIGGFCRVYAMPCMPCQRRPGKKIRLSEFELPTTRHLSHDSGLVEKNTPDACRNGQAASCLQTAQAIRGRARAMEFQAVPSMPGRRFVPAIWREDIRIRLRGDARR